MPSALEPIAPRAAPSLRGMTRRWIMREVAGDPAATAFHDLPPLVQRVLAARGMADREQMLAFCEPKLSSLCETALMPGVDRAAARIIDAIRRDQLIAIYGDYDVDGVTATAILFHTIKAINPAARLRCYVPHRLDEGYGVNCDALRQLKAEGVELVITVDCGITAVASAQTAREIGLDIIITDHHEMKAGELPDAYAVVHPRLPGSEYPFADLCGAGVAFKLAWHLAKMWCNSDRVSESLQKLLINMLPLVALGTVADVVPLLGENRVLTAFGLRLIRQTPLVGLRALIDASGLADEKIDSQRVGFMLAPRLNACGRMGHAADAVRLFTEAGEAEAHAIAQQLTEQNKHRQLVERRIFDEAARLADDAGMTRNDHRAIVLAHHAWHPGVVGIVCSRMVERFSRPTILLQRGEQMCKGSARSIDGYSIHDGLCACASYLATYGGHAMAAGLSLLPQHLQAFAEALTAHANRHITCEQLTPSLLIDCEAPLSEMDETAVRRLLAMAPFGRGNRTPAILLANVVLAEAPRQMGANGKHLQLRFRTDGPDGRQWLRGVWWSAGERAADFAAGMRMDIAIEPKLNEWGGRTTVEAELLDVRVRSDLEA